MTVTDTRAAPPKDVEVDTKAPSDPRKARDVLLALKHAARRDPHPDPLKPIGRASFFIWLVILAGLFIARPVAHAYVDTGRLQAEASAFYSDIIGNDHARQNALKRLTRNPYHTEILAIMGFAAGTLLFAAYYVGVYLIAINLARSSAHAGVLFYLGIVRPALRASRGIFERVPRQKDGSTKTPAGPEPALQ